MRSAGAILNSGDTAFLVFSDSSGNAAPTAQGYSVTVTSPTAFTVTAPQLSTGTYGQTNGIITAREASRFLEAAQSVTSLPAGELHQLNVALPAGTLTAGKPGII